MIYRTASEFSRLALSRLSDSEKMVLPAPVLQLSEVSFRQGAFWAVEEVVRALEAAWGFKKRDGDYLETLKSVVGRIKGTDDAREAEKGLEVQNVRKVQ